MNPRHRHLHRHRRQALAALFALPMLGLAAPARASAKTLPLSHSLPSELAQALAQKQPLVVMVNLLGCPWCKLVREHYLAPMHASEGLPVVQVDWSSKQATRTVAGEPTTHAELVRAWKIKLAPTVLFLGPGGSEVAERLEGGSPDFYSGYLDQRLEQARRAIGG